MDDTLTPNQAGDSIFDLSAMEGDIFSESYFEDQKRSFSDQIERLQQRQLELVKQTAEELEILKRQLDSKHELERRAVLEREPLREEINRLRDTILNLEAETRQKDQQFSELQQLFQSQYSQMQGVFDSLKSVVRGQVQALDQQIRVFSLEANQNLDSLLDHLTNSSLPAVKLEVEPTHNFALSSAAAPSLRWPTPLEPVNLPTNPPAKLEEKKMVEEKKVKVKKERKEKRPLPIRRLLRRSLSFCLIIGLGYFGFGKVKNFLTGSHIPVQAGQVAGVSTDSSITKTTSQSSGSEKVAPSEYAESFAEIPFNETVWDEANDPDFGLKIDYPKNTTNKVRVIGGSNLWFLRQNGYLMKISRIDTPDTLDKWWENNKKDYADGYAYNKGSFKNQPAIVGQPEVHDKTSGIQYFMRRGPVIYQIWIKEEPPTSDDGQRLAHMISSLRFTNE